LAELVSTFVFYSFDFYPISGAPVVMSDPTIAPVPVGSLYRHGDVLLRTIAHLPSGLRPARDLILTHGEVTGHSHRIERPETAQLWEQGSQLFLEVKSPVAHLIHEEHRTIELPRGLYRVWKQREYRPEAPIDVED
jgi:hypothetical protein